jgi:hypothetical protein
MVLSFKLQASAEKKILAEKSVCGAFRLQVSSFGRPSNEKKLTPQNINLLLNQLETMNSFYIQINLETIPSVAQF